MVMLAAATSVVVRRWFREAVASSDVFAHGI